MVRSRDEELFWHMIAVYGTPDPSGVRSRDGVKGIDYMIENSSIASPLLEVRCLTSAFGVHVWLCTNYQGCGSAESQELSVQIPECEEIAAKFYPWDDFRFDRFINWTTSFNE